MKTIKIKVDYRLINNKYVKCGYMIKYEGINNYFSCYEFAEIFAKNRNLILEF